MEANNKRTKRDMTNRIRRARQKETPGEIDRKGELGESEGGKEIRETRNDKMMAETSQEKQISIE